MQQVTLELDHCEIYCPVTGQQIFGDNYDFKPSPALIYVFVDEGASFEFAPESMIESFDKFMEESQGDCEESYKKVVKGLDSKESTNWVCFSIEDSMPMANIGFAHFCFDMNYTKD